MSKPKFQLDDVKAHARGKWDMIFPQFAITMPLKNVTRLVQHVADLTVFVMMIKKKWAIFIAMVAVQGMALN